MMERLTRGKRRDEILHPDASEEPSVVKKWCRRHDNGCVGVVAAWSDGGYTGGYSEYLPSHGGLQIGPRYTYDTLTRAFEAADAAGGRRGHVCSDGCALWGEVPATPRRHIG